MMMPYIFCWHVQLDIIRKNLEFQKEKGNVTSDYKSGISYFMIYHKLIEYLIV